MFYVVQQNIKYRGIMSLPLVIVIIKNLMFTVSYTEI